MNNNGFSIIIYSLIISFFGAFAKETNYKSKSRESFNIFFGEIILHGFSGWIVGLGLCKYLNVTDLISITIFAGVGGLFGYNLVKLGLKISIKFLASAKNINIDDSDIDFDEEQK